ncbi:MAG: 4-hydroxythreonine-4-phosphate dehydrogenase PdxA [Myxococcales bacterium]|nr:4-hydroxythreonine-4-phosphate dehydrogenase PdxA [Myxococcales bacterium]MCB9643130.1 4-hydroxythreonine-4-phosphate dehydrogenase PdxA [Myxococcales bacterium]
MNQRVVGVTMGDPAGVGGEVLVRAMHQLFVDLEAGELPREALAICGDIHVDIEAFRDIQWKIYGDRKRLEEIAMREGTPSLVDLPNVEIVEVETEGSGFGWGQLSEQGALAQVSYLRSVLSDVADGKVHALATGPIHKQALAMMGVPHVGHTEWLAAEAGVEHPVMMLAGPRLRVIPATIHIALRDVKDALQPELLNAIIETTVVGMKRWLGFSHPRLAICGVNPHAGDGGLMGDEEVRWLGPLVHELASTLPAEIRGPLPADTAFYFAAQGQDDAVIAMYHDQALAPLKLLHFEEAINLTLGLPYLRTSVDHGTAYDIAGKGKASARSMLNALVIAGCSLSLAFSKKDH